jgi:hypothetical protein
MQRKPVFHEGDNVKKIAELWNSSDINRTSFISYMLCMRMVFDVCGNLTYGTPLAFIFFVIYAVLQLFMMRARVRNFGGNVGNWTQFYSIGLEVQAMLVLMPSIPWFSYITSLRHFNMADYAFDFVMVCPFVTLCVLGRPPLRRARETGICSARLAVAADPGTQ